VVVSGKAVAAWARRDPDGWTAALGWLAERGVGLVRIRPRAEKQRLLRDASVGLERVDPRERATASRSVFDGIVPVLMQTPPTHCCRSTMATRRPSLGPWMAA
jgi:hypothetical protein